MKQVEVQKKNTFRAYLYFLYVFSALDLRQYSGISFFRARMRGFSFGEEVKICEQQHLINIMHVTTNLLIILYIKDSI